LLGNTAGYKQKGILCEEIKMVAIDAASASQSGKVGFVNHSKVSNDLLRQTRNLSTDTFRFISLLLIFLDHSTYPREYYVFFIPFIGFDTVLVNAGSALGSRASRTKHPYRPYLWRKIKCIVIPVYIYLFTVWMVNIFSPMPFCITPFFHTLVRLFGFLWIIRGYFLIYAVSPFIIEYHQKETSHMRYYCTVGLASVLLTVTYNFILKQISNLPLLHRLFENNIGICFLFPVMYACFFRVPDLSYTQYWRLFFALISITISIMLAYQWKGENYHPRFSQETVGIHYCTYGLSAAMVYYRLSPLLLRIILSLAMEKIATFTSSHSMWVYLHHITFQSIARDETSLFHKWFILSTAAICLTYLQSRAVEVIASRVRPSVAANLRLILG